MSSRNNQQNHTIYKVVLTGGPCGGKTTGQNRLATFFEQLGWKVFRIPETATILLNGGVKFNDLTPAQSFKFQEDLLLTMMRIEDTYGHLAETFHSNVLLIYDRGTMDPSAYIDPSGWQLIMQRNNLNAIDIRDNRYNQVVHLTTAADGAEQFYTLANNTARSEDITEAIKADALTRGAWVGHPYFDVVDNTKTKSFDDKMRKLIQIVCDRIGIDYGDRLEANAIKRKWLVTEIDWAKFPEKRQQFDVIHDYLLSDNPNVQVRIRKRGQNDRWSYTSTVRRLVNGDVIETKLALNKREYEQMRANRDYRRVLHMSNALVHFLQIFSYGGTLPPQRREASQNADYANPAIPNFSCTTYKKRLCFNYERTYWQLDIYQPPLPPGSPNEQSLMLLETYTTRQPHEIILPSFLKVQSEVTGQKNYSMFTLSARPSKPMTQFPTVSTTTNGNHSPTPLSMHNGHVH